MAASSRFDIDAIRARSTGVATGRSAGPAQQVALRGGDPQALEGDELLRRLHALGHDRRARPAGHLAQAAQDRQRRLVEQAALDEREVDLDDVERDLAQEAQPGVARPDVVGGDAHARGPDPLQVALQAGQILDGLALGELDDDLARLQPVAAQDPDQLADLELLGLEAPRRQVQAQVEPPGELPDPGGDRLDRGHVELHDPVGDLGCREQARGVREARTPAWAGRGPRSRPGGP